MQLYRLGPKHGDTSDHNWKASTSNEECWVLATSETDAREIVKRATHIGSTKEAGSPLPTSSWYSSDLTYCVPDNHGREPPAGFILTVSGRMIPIV
jgi:hypothetical protein